MPIWSPRARVPLWENAVNVFAGRCTLFASVMRMVLICVPGGEYASVYGNGSPWPAPKAYRKAFKINALLINRLALPKHT